MKTGSIPQALTISAVPFRRFGTLTFVPLLALVALLLLFWHISPIASLAQTPTAPNAIRYAAPTGSGNICSQVNPCALQTAVTLAANGDEIRVLEGTYPNAPSQPTLVITRNVTIRGGFNAPDWSGPDPVLTPTFLESDGSSRVVYHFNNATAVLDGFHIHGGGSVQFGGGVNIENGQLTIDHSWIYDNNATTSGGGLFVNTGATGIIQNSEIYDNSAPGGGGIFVNFGGAQAQILFNNIHNNAATSGAGWGGGVYVNNNSTAFLEGNHIHHNAANLGGGILTSGAAAATAQNNMIYANTANSDGGGFYAFGGLNSWHNTVVGNSANTTGGGFGINTATTVNISNTIVASNTAPTGSGIHRAGGTVTGDYINLFNNTSNVPFPTTITADPKFLNYIGFVNLHLAQGSPNINVGNSTIPQDIDQQARPEGPAPDIGADEFYPNVPAFSFTPLFTQEFVERGSVASFEHILINENSTEPDTYTFACANDLGWGVICPGPETVPVGQFVNVTTQITVPGSATALQAANTIITATSAVSPSLQHAVLVRSIVSPLPGIQFTPNYSTTNPPGEVITLTHTLTNTGDAPDTIRVDIVSDTLGWAQLVPPGPLFIPLGVGASDDIQVRITIPPQAAGIIPNITTIRATSSYSNSVSAEVIDTVRAEETAGTRYVRPGGNDTNNNCTVPTFPCATVPHAIGQAVTNDEVRIGFGTYNVTAVTEINETLHVSGNWEHNFSAQNEAYETVIQQTGSFQIFNLSGSSNNSTFDSLILRNGNAGALRGGAVVVNTGVQASFTNITFANNQAERGGALQVGNGGLAIVTRSRFNDNTASFRGGAIHVEGGTLALRQSALNNNAITGGTGDGGGIYVLNGVLIVENTLFNENTAVTNGGALFVQSSNSSVNFATIVNNNANSGGGIYVTNGGGQSFQLNNSILADNTAVAGGGALHVANGSITGEFVNFFNNNPGDFGTIIITNQLNAVPGFVPGDPEFHLLADSAMVDARLRNQGNPANQLDKDFEDDNRPSDEGYDLGYDELAGCQAKRDSTVFGSIQAALEMENPQSNLILVSGICRGVHPISVGGPTIFQTVHITGTTEITIQGGWTGDFDRRLIAETTIVDPQGLGRAFYFNGPVSVTLEYLTIRNGDAAGLGGGPSGQDAGGQMFNTGGQVTLKAVTMLDGTADHGAAYYQDSGSLQTDLLVATTDNFDPPDNNDDLPLRGRVQGGAASNGGGFHINGGTAVINATEIMSNTAVNGGAIYHANGNLTASNNVLAFNNVSGDGGGVFHNGPAPAQLLHNTFYQNSADSDGGAIYRQSGSGALTIRSSIFQNNDALNGDAIHAPAGTVENYNYYFGQAAPLAGGITLGANSNNQGTGGTPPGLLDPANGNFHLSNTAPAVDRGDPASSISRDFDGDLRPSNQGPDMGADEVAGCRVEVNGVIYGSIQEAINNAQPGDVVRVSGICSGVHEYDTGGPPGGCRGDNGIIFTTVHIDKNIILQGGWNDGFLTQNETTVLDANGLGRVVHIAPGVTATIENFSIINGALTGVNGNGAGICIDHASPTIRHNEIMTHTATNGAAVYSINSAALLDGNRIYNSHANAMALANGGGIYATSSNGTAVSIVNNFIYDNSANTNGGAFYSASGNHQFWHNTVVANTAAQGAGAYVAAGGPQFRSAIFMDNDAPSPANTDGVHGATGSTPSVNYSDFFGQDVNLGGTAVGANNLTVDPQLSPAYTLTLNSPMLDAGDPALTLDHDFEDDLRPSHLGFDIGADEIAGCVARNLAAPTVIYGSLQRAVDAAADGDTIEVDGICLNARAHPNSSGSIQNLFVDKALTIDGDWNSGLVPNGNLTATLNALDNGRVLYVAATGVLTLTNIHLTNGDANGAGLSDHGGGVYNAGTLLLDTVEILANVATNGGGMYNVGSLTTHRSRIQDNTAAQGGGVYNSGGTAVFADRNHIANNDVSGSGAGIHQAGGNLTLDGNRIYGNEAPSGNGGGIYLTGGNTIVRNNFIYQNSALGGGGLYNANTNTPIWHNTFYLNAATGSGQNGGGIFSATSQPVLIRSNIVHASQGSGIHITGQASPNIDYNNVADNLANGSPANYTGNAAPGPNDISVPPNYVSAINGNLHLRSWSAGVDDADPAVPFNHDIDSDVRPTNGGPDRGADEINSCLIRVIDPLDPNPATREHIFGVLQFAIDFAEGFAPGPFPTVEIARGECSGVRQDSETGTWQVGIVREDLDFSGSLQRSNFQYVGDYTSDQVGTLTTRINANYEGRAIYVHTNADPTFRHIAFVNGNAALGGGSANGGAIIVPGNGSVELLTAYVCESAANNGGGIYLSGSSGVVRQNYITGSTIGECIPAHVEENENGSIGLVVPLFYEGNVASGSGGGLYNSGALGITDVAFYVNDAGANGGGIANTANELRIINGLFYSNTAVTSGGALFNTGANLEVYHTTITENAAQTGHGGGIRAEATGFILNSTIIDSNLAPANPGGSGLSTPGGLGPILAYNNFFNNGSTEGVGTNPVNGDPDLRGFYPVFPPINSPVIDRADPALLDPGVPVPGGSFYPIDFDARLVIRPDGGTEHLATRASDVGAIEWWKDFGCTVTPTPQQQTAVPGTTVTYNFQVTNTGYPYPPSDNRHGFIDTIVISLTSSAGWGSLEGGNVQTFVDMNWNENRPITLTVDVPADAQNGQFDLSTIQCRSQSKPDRVNEGRATTFVGLVSGVIVYPPYTAAAQPGDVLTFNHTVENIGNETHTFNILPSAGLRHASAVLLENGLPVTLTQATLASNQTRDVVLQVTILDTALRDEVANPGVVAIQVDNPQNTGAVQNDILILGEPGPRYVAPGGQDINNNCRVPAIPCGTINHAIYAAEPGDAIFVAQGTYTDFSSEPIGIETFTQNVFINKSVHIYGGYSTLDDFTTQYPITQTTRLDGQGVRRVIAIMPGITVTLSGLFIENGNAAAQFGAPLYGGGVYNVDSSLTVTATFFLDNAASLGGGLYQSGGQLAVNSSVFAGNGDLAASSNGGGVYLEGVTAVLENNTFAGNGSGAGGAVYGGDEADFSALNNIFSENEAITTPGSAVFVTTTAVITEDYSLYWLNDTNFVTGTNSFTAEPGFLDVYFHLSAASPAKDAGTELTSRDWGVDYDIQPRILGPTIDIGADERLQVPSFTLLPVTATAVITAGEPYAYEHVLTNTGDPEDSYTLNVLNEEVTPGGNWDVSLTPANTGLLSTNESVTVTLVITGDVPGAILRSLITATSDNYPLTVSATDTTTVRFDPEVDIAADESGDTAPNVPIVYSHTLTNTGSGIDRFALSVLAENPAGWAIGIAPTQTAFLAAGETMTFTVSVTPPPGTPPTVIHTVQVEARSLNTLGIVVTDTLTDTTTVLEAAGLELLPTAQTQTIPDDSTAVYFHTLQNTGNITTAADLAISGVPAGWPVTVEPASVNLAPAQTVPVTVTVTAPPGSGGLTHVASITATAVVDPSVQATAVDTTTVLVLAGVIIEPDNLIITDPDTVITFTHTVTNTGNGAETFDLSYVNTLTWTTTIIPDFVTLAQGESAEVLVEVVVPPDAVPDAPNFTTVTARSRSNPDVFDTAVDETRIRQMHSLILVPDQTGVADPGTTIVYTHWLTNTGNGTDEFMITAVTENGWPTTPPPATFTLSPGAGTELTVALEVPIGAAGRTEIMTVTAASVISPTATAQAIDTTNVTGTPGTLGVLLDPDRTGSGNPGDTLTYLHTITNTGDIAEQFLLTVTSANGWVTGVSPLSIILSAGEAANVQVTTTIPVGAGGGSSDVATVLARSQTDAAVFDTAVDTTTVLGDADYGVIIEPDNSSTANAGDTVLYTHWVTNTGSVTDTFTLATVSSNGWPTPDPLPVTLAAGASRQITATLIIPAAVMTTTDVMTVTAVSITDPAATDNAIDTTFVNGVSGTLGVLLEPDNAATGTPGATVQYIHQMTNTGTVTDDYVVTAVSSQGWTVVTVPASGTIIRLMPGQMANVVVRVTVPGTATDGIVDVTTVTAVSLSDSSIQDIARDITTIEVDVTPPTIYLPIILRPGDTPPPTPTSTPVTPTPTSTPCAPPTNIDLIVTQIQVVPAAPISGQPATVYVTIRNQGSQSVPFGNNFFLDFYVDRTPQPYLVGDIAWGVQGADLTAGTSRTYQGQYTFGGGAHQLWAQVDTDRHVNECPNEHNNNFGPVNITVSGAIIEGLAGQPQYGPRQTPEPVLPTGTPTPGLLPTQPPLVTPTLPPFTPTPTPWSPPPAEVTPPAQATPTLPPPGIEEAPPTATPTP